MANQTVVGFPAFFNEDVSFFKDVYVYGRLYAKTDASLNDLFISSNLFVSGISTFKDKSYFFGDIYFKNIEVNGIATFRSDVYVDKEIKNLKVGILTASQRLNVGVGGTVLSAIAGVGSVGIGTTMPERALDVSGDIRLQSQLYDSLNSPGVLGAFLTKDAQGVKWVEYEPVFGEGIFVYDDDVLVGVESFRGINFKIGKGSGITTDPVIGVANSSNPNIADIYVYDFWDVVKDTTNIYRNSAVGINCQPTTTFEVLGDSLLRGSLTLEQAAILQNTLTVSSQTDLLSSLYVSGVTFLNNNLTVSGITAIDNKLSVSGVTSISNKLYVSDKTFLNSTLDVTDATALKNTLTVDSSSLLKSTLTVQGQTNLQNALNVIGPTTINNTLSVANTTALNSRLSVGGTSLFKSYIKLDSSLYDVNNSAAIGKYDYRLASVGTGVSWRPSGVETKRTIWVTMNGNDNNSGLLEGDSKASIGAAAAIAKQGDTIVVRPGVYYENNPVGLRTDVTVTGQDLRLVTVIPNNLMKDVFHVRRGCLVENLSFACPNASIANTDGGAVAFPPSTIGKIASSGYIALGPATEGETGRWKSPYVRNCTNFMKESIGMRIDGNDATASTPGADLKSMVCDSFTQYNEAGIGVSITNNGYAQLVSIFTINCHIGIFCATGGACDITNSNSSFGNFGLVADGLGPLEFTAFTENSTNNVADIFVLNQVKDDDNNYRTPYNGQAVWFEIDIDGETLNSPLVDIDSIEVLNTLTGYSPSSPPSMTIVDTNNSNSIFPLGPQGIVAQVSPNIDPISGTITSVDVINSGRNYLPSQNLVLAINGEPSASFKVNTAPIYYTVSKSTPVSGTGIATVTFNEFIPYLVPAGTKVNMYRISRIQTSSHSFEYIGSGTDINTSNPFQGALYDSAKQVVALNGARIPYTSTNQAGNFEIGKGIVVDQTTSTIRGRDFSRAIQAEVTPLILALR